MTMQSTYTFIPAKKFNVYLKSHTGNSSILTHRGRTAWSYKTAKKHMLDCVALKMNKGQFVDIAYFAVLDA